MPEARWLVRGGLLAFVEPRLHLFQLAGHGQRAGAAGGFVTVMVPDLMPPDDEMRRLYTAECPDLHAVRALLEAGTL